MTVTETSVPASRQATTVELVLTLECPVSPGIVYAVSCFLLELGCDIIDI